VADSSKAQGFLTGHDLPLLVDDLPLFRRPIDQDCPADHILDRQQTPLM
jgi:hypothetical protein